MRNLIYILAFLLTSTIVFPQEIVRPNTDYYSTDSIRNRTDAFRAIIDGVKKWSESGFKEMDLPVYQPTLRLRLPDMNQLEYHVDTTLWVRNIQNVTEIDSTKYFIVLYRKDSTKAESHVLKIKALDKVPCINKNVLIKFRSYYKGLVYQRSEEIE